MRFATNALFAVAATLLCMAPAHAAYPDRPIRLIVPWAPGGSTDALARLVAEKLTASLGQPVIVENKPGASGNIGSDFVAKSKPDGYTLLVGLGNTHVVNPAIYANMPFKGVEDFTPVAMLGFVTTTMVVNPEVPVSNVAEFIAYAKANPGKLAYASAGVGSSTHLDGAVFAKLAGIDMLHVPFKGGAPAMQETIAGRTQVQFSAANLTLPQVNAGKLKLLAVTGSKRAAILPNVPTVAETLPGFDKAVWYGVFGPAGMPKELTNKLNAEINRFMNAPEQKKTLEDIGIEVSNETPDQFRATLHKEADFYGKLIKDLNIQAE
jgi:tripartite-type tricarboxylate transporter receptor subunit TctC